MKKNVINTNIQTVDFYGEQLTWPVADLIHCEPLENRSQEHAWKINAHRHEQLSQFFFVESGAGLAYLDGQRWQVNGPSLLYVPIGVVHSFDWQPHSSGQVISIAQPLLARFVESFALHFDLLKQPKLLTSTRDVYIIRAQCEAICREYAGGQIRQALMHSMVFTLLNFCVQSAPRDDHKSFVIDARCEHFKQLIEQYFNRQQRVEWYADHLHVSAVYLNSLCQKHLGQSAQSLIHQRILLEAKRLLIYTVRPNSSIAMDLGFSDPSYFNRFFKRLCKVTPKEFRQLSSNQSP